MLVIEGLVPRVVFFVVFLGEYDVFFFCFWRKLILSRILLSLTRPSVLILSGGMYFGSPLLLFGRSMLNIEDG